jgi:hypothetical protein
MILKNASRNYHLYGATSEDLRKDHKPVFALMSVVVQRFQSLRRETRNSVKYPEIDILYLKKRIHHQELQKSYSTILLLTL